MRLTAFRALGSIASLVLVPALSHAQFDPEVQLPEEAILASPSGPFEEHFGANQDLSGRYLLVGAEFNDAQAVNSGAAYLYQRTSEGWILDSTFYGSQSPKKGRFGSSVAIDGDVAVVASVRDPWAGDWSGAVYVFRNMGPVWVEEAIIRASDGHADHRFGSSVAIYGDTIVVGADGDMDAAAESGALYLYQYAHGGLWIPQQKIKAPVPRESATFGDRIRIDGDRIVTSERLHDAQGISGVGALHVFHRTGSFWAEEATLVGSDPYEFRFMGWQFDLSGNRIVASVRGDGLAPGKIKIFEHDGVSWSEDHALTGGHNLDFRDVALEGDTLIAGADGHVVGVPGTGIATVFHEIDGTWTQRGRLYSLTPPYANETLGYTVSISGNSIAVTGSGPGDRGHVYAHFVPSPPQGECQPKPTSIGCTPTLGWTGFPAVTTSNEFRIHAVDLLNRKPALLFYGFAPSSVPFQGGTLCVAPPRNRIPPALTGGSPSGSDCTGSLDIDFHARIQSGSDPSLQKGTQVHTQAWFRDPGDAFGAGLTDALSFVIGQ